MDMKNILENKKKLNIDLYMSPNGFEIITNILKSNNEESPQVYVHVGSEGNLENQVLRIGTAQNGVHNRWITSSNGHKNTFLWSIGKGDGYKKGNAEKYPNYLLFFASLFQLKTKLYVYSFPSGDKAKECEDALIDYYGPIWERYFVLSGKKRDFPKLAGNFPILTGSNKNRNIVASVARLGGALKVIEKQRNGNIPFSQPIQDSVDMNMRSLRTW